MLANETNRTDHESTLHVLAHDECRNSNGFFNTRESRRVIDHQLKLFQGRGPFPVKPRSERCPAWVKMLKPPRGRQQFYITWTWPARTEGTRLLIVASLADCPHDLIRL
jgi:hypothetical protein